MPRQGEAFPSSRAVRRVLSARGDADDSDDDALRAGLTLVLVHDERNPSDTEWTQWVRFFATAARRESVRRLFVVSRGGGPNRRQRMEVVDALVGCLGHGARDANGGVHRLAFCARHHYRDRVALRHAAPTQLRP